MSCFICEICKTKEKEIEFDNEKELQKHQWTYHPKNNIERTWSKHALCNFKNWKGSSYYESFGPYY
tara:strand:+ start:2896 stop:3093 length:198 start_codon:yes stop_codon:yes gene_type:complete